MSLASETAGERSPMRKRAADAAPTAIAFALLAFVGFLLLPRGINLSDEGFLLQQSIDMLAGKVLYRDIEMFIAPGIWFVMAGFFSVVEPSVLASRWVAAASYFALAWLIFRIVRKHTNARYGAACVASYAVLAVWSFPHWTWAWYSPFSILFALLAMQALFAWDESGRTQTLVWVGACCGLTAIFKQNYGFFALAACAISVIALESHRALLRRRTGETEGASAVIARVLRAGVWITVGLLAAIGPLLIYFGFEGALWSIYDRFVLYPMEFTTAANIPYLDFAALFDHGIFEDRVTSTNYMSQLALASPANISLLPSPSSIHLLHALLYWLPPLVLLAGAVLCVLPGGAEPGDSAPDASRFDWVLFVSTAMSALLFLGIFPRADFTHLITVYQPLFVTAALVVHRLVRRIADPAPLWSWLPMTAGIALFGFYALAAAAWLLFLSASMTERLPQPRGGVLVHKISAVGINQLVEVVRAHTKEGEPFFGLPDMAMINFLSERDVPGSQYQTYAHMIARDEGLLTKEQLVRADVRFAIARYDNVLSTEPRLERYAPILAQWLESNFEPTSMIQNDQYLLLERRSTPFHAAPTLEILDDCQYTGGSSAKSGPPPPSSVRQHLLFASLFQPLRPDVPVESAETSCRIRVPESGATLRLQLGYKRPDGMQRGATLTGSVDVVVDGVRQPLFEQTLRVESTRLDGVPMPAEHRVDLSHLAGREISLIFRTERRGRVKTNPFTLETYAMFWQDPVLELPTGGEAVR